ncbi:M6 family metalloprotease domain-containing protein [Coralliovum pocilloporae]|uniref:M6 family metalloprotease domain-containing protein n=1 Tax=Coralliovum pocilloporae TaxID=3066369 RepID=UPI0033077805
MCGCDHFCMAPPSPELEEQIIRSKQRLDSGAGLPETGDDTVLDFDRAYRILNRPKKTRAHTLIQRVADRSPVVGTRKALVLLVDFSDHPASQSQAHYSNMLFSQGTYPTGSMRDYYREASYNQLDVTGEVSGTGGPTAGWYRAPQTKAYYTNNDFGFGSYPQNAQKLVEDVVDLAAPHVNFADYDNDGDGVVDALVIIVAGSGGEATGNKGDVWSHKWSITPRVKDGVRIQSYFMAPEDGRVGVMSHELGHLLMKWPDLYDTDYSSRGTGRWDLMAGGSWNNGGNTPAHPTAWCKLQAGWISPSTVTGAAQDVTIQPYNANGDVYKLPIGGANSKEYFLVSNRQRSGFDSHIPGEGCLIEHVDDNQSNNTDEDHYLVDIEQADGRRDLNTNANSGDAEDVYPTASNNRFDGASTPNSNSYNGTASNISITNIQRAGNTITARIDTGGGGGGGGGAATEQWHTNKAVLRTYTSHHSQNAWAFIEDLGWLKVETGFADGVTNCFVLLCDARSNGRNVSVFTDGTTISRAYLL